MIEEKIVIVNGARTPVGSFGGVFMDVPGHELGAAATRAALGRAGVAGADVREVVMGCIGQVGADAYNARRVAITVGLPTSVPAYTVNRLCGSGLQERSGRRPWRCAGTTWTSLSPAGMSR